MEAQVTVKMTVQELDVLRNALERDADAQYAMTKDSEIDVRTRSAARARHVQVTDLLTRLK